MPSGNGCTAWDGGVRIKVFMTLNLYWADQSASSLALLQRMLFMLKMKPKCGKCAAPTGLRDKA